MHVSEALCSKLDEAIDPSLSLHEIQKLERLLLDYRMCFLTNLDMLTYLVSHQIGPGNHTQRRFLPIKKRPHRLPYT